jgi:hypothetical protein
MFSGAQTIKWRKDSRIEHLLNDKTAVLDWELMDVADFGWTTLHIGNKLSHSPSCRDGKDDYFMEKKGSGFFAIDDRHKEDKSCYIYEVIKEFNLPTLFANYSFDGKEEKNIDILPEFTALLCGEVCNGSTQFDFRGQTNPNGCYTRFQMTALLDNMLTETWKVNAQKYVKNFQEKMSELKFPGWVGADMNGHIEIFLISPVDVSCISFVKRT